MSNLSTDSLLKAGVHFGHRASKWHPKMKSFIYGTRQGIHVVDVTKTAAELEKAKAFITDVIGKGGTVMFVSTKLQSQGAVADAAKACGMPYVNTRWLGGTLTNWPQIQRIIRHYLDLKDKRDKGELRKYTKLEQLNFDREIAELDEKIGGISTMTRLPEAVIVMDARHDKTVIREANTMHVPIVALVDTNVNPAGISYVIPGNDDAVSSVTIIAQALAGAVTEGKKIVVQNQAAKAATQATKVEKTVIDTPRQNAEA